ncbi:MAG TPA: alpha/beta fold hydrolase [Gaiellaceae bacterium]|nr:alpha/beta fold hydrolase [Gaiellaceae bacterium]
MEPRIVRAPDGRELEVFDCGATDGVPVLVHHGTPSSGLPYARHVRDAEEKGIRLVGYSRPGYGRSTSQAGRTIADAAADVEAICDTLGLERICSWGISGGGPHVLACAALLPERIAAAASLASVAPYEAAGLDWLAGMGEGNVEEFAAAVEGRDALESYVAEHGAELLAASPGQIVEVLATLLSEADAAVLTGAFAEHMLESTRHGIGERVDGWVDDDLAFARPWGFDVAAIRVPLQLWQGELDRFVPFAHGEWLAARIPGVDARLSAGDGHLTLIERRVPEVHAWLLERFAG